MLYNTIAIKKKFETCDVTAYSVEVEIKQIWVPLFYIRAGR